MSTPHKLGALEVAVPQGAVKEGILVALHMATTDITRVAAGAMHSGPNPSKEGISMHRTLVQMETMMAEIITQNSVENCYYNLSVYF